VTSDKRVLHTTHRMMSGRPFSVIGSMANNNNDLAIGDASHHDNGTTLTTMHRNYAAPTNLLLWPGESTAPCVHLLIPPNVSTGRWTLQVLESTLEYLTCIIQRLPSIRNHVDNACLVQCGGGNNLLVLLNGAAIPNNIHTLPKIRVTICLTDTIVPPPPANDNMSQQNGNGRISDLSDQFGTIQPNELLWMHFDSHVAARRHAFGSTTATTATRIYLMAQISPSLPDAGAAAPMSLSALPQHNLPPLQRIVRFGMDPPNSWNIVSVERVDGPPNGFARAAAAPAAVAAKPKAPRKSRAPKVVADASGTSLSVDASTESKPKATRKPRTPKATPVTESAVAGSSSTGSSTSVAAVVVPAKKTKSTGAETLPKKSAAALPKSAVAATGTSTVDENKGSKPPPPKKTAPSTVASKKQAPSDKPAVPSSTTQKRAPPSSSLTKPAASSSIKPAAIDIAATDDDDATVSDDASVVQGTAAITSATDSRADVKKSPARKRKAAAAIPVPISVADPDATQDEDDDDMTPVSGNLSNADDTPVKAAAPAAKKPRATKAKAKQRPPPPYTFGFTNKELAELQTAMDKDDNEAADDDGDDHAVAEDDDDASEDESIAAVMESPPPSPPPKTGNRMPRAAVKSRK
jgi:hypothetical protein